MKAIDEIMTLDGVASNQAIGIVILLSLLLLMVVALFIVCIEQERKLSELEYRILDLTKKLNRW